MPNRDALYIGLDIGTGGARAMAVGCDGTVAAEGRASFSAPSRVEGDRHEQDAESWIAAAEQALREMVRRLHDAAIDPRRLRSLAVDGTSGTIVLVDDAGRPLTAGLMYNDLRAGAQAKRIGAAPAMAISKMHWLAEHEPQAFARSQWFAHQADFVLGRLGGCWGVSDYSNALKSRYDIVADRWDASIPREIAERLPRVVAPGTLVGRILPAVAEQLGLPAHLKLATGASDGTAGFLASGAKQPGDDNTTLGTTLVFKRIADRYCEDPAGLTYCHKLPGGLWLPGAASSTGGQWQRELFAGADLAAMDQQAAAMLPVDDLAYPLTGMGERFPCIAARAKRADTLPADASDVRRYAAYLQGVAMLERWAYEVLDRVTGIAGGDVYATGGGAGSEVWTQLRADVTGRTVHRPACCESAFGAAVLAASEDLGGLRHAIAAMVRMRDTIRPRSDRLSRYDAIYNRYRTWMKPILGESEPVLGASRP